jgi:hypothetical protein
MVFVSLMVSWAHDGEMKLRNREQTATLQTALLHAMRGIDAGPDTNRSAGLYSYHGAAPMCSPKG